MANLKALKGRIEAVTKVDTSSDIQEAINYIDNGFLLVDNGTALEHPKGGYIKISKRVQNYYAQSKNNTTNN